MAIEDPVLGTLVEEGIRFSGEFLYEGRTLSLGIYPDGDDWGEVIETARTVVQAVHDIDKKAKEASAAKMLKVYNENWRSYEEVDDDDNLVSVENPVLSAEEFMGRMTLDAINVSGKDSCDLFYTDDQMFSGHSIVVGSFDARKFDDELNIRLYG